MGYCFDPRGRIVCDSCGVSGGVRKRRCAYKVDGLPYCPAPALCGPCYSKHGGLRGVHGERCREGAAESQARSDADKAREAAGDRKVRSAYGSWHEDVPKGKVGVYYGDDTYVLVDEAEYKYPYPWLSELGTAEPWLAYIRRKALAN